jgi:hypothetical protein
MRNLSQRELGEKVHVSGDLVAMVEKARRYPQPDFAKRCDEALDAGGDLIRHWKAVEQERRLTVSTPTHADSPGVGMAGPLPGFFIDPRLSASFPAGNVAFRVDEVGTVWVEIGRRSFMVGSVAALLGAGSKSSLPMAIPADDPFGFSSTTAGLWPDLRLSRPIPDYGTDWTMLLPGGSNMLGTSVAAQIHPARSENGHLTVSIADDRRATEFLSRPTRGLIVGAKQSADESTFYVADARSANQNLAGRGGSRELSVPDAYRLDDVTFGLLWAVANLDDALQADDQALNETRKDLRVYDQLSASAVSREAAPGLNPIAHMYLGSEFCARHILRGLSQLPALPAFWTREQRGEEASTWLLFDHKYHYLKQTTETLGSASTRAFCIPEDVVRQSPKFERVLLLLAVALMESLGIHVQLTTDPGYSAVEGFVIAPHKQAIIANWVGGDGMWHVDMTARPTFVRQFTDVAGHMAAHSEIEAPTAAERVRAFANYLDLPWTWLQGRCAELGRHGTSDLIQPRSRLISAVGLDAACEYVGSLPAAL